MATATAHPNGATADETPLRQCLACDKAFVAGTGHGKYCGRRCATIHGNQTAALARAANLVEDFEERLDRAIAQHLDRVLALTVDATLPPLVQGEVAAVVPAAVKEEVATQMAAAMAEIAAKQAAEPRTGLCRMKRWSAPSRPSPGGAMIFRLAGSS